MGAGRCTRRRRCPARHTSRLSVRPSRPQELFIISFSRGLVTEVFYQHIVSSFCFLPTQAQVTRVPGEMFTFGTGSTRLMLPWVGPTNNRLLKVHLCIVLAKGLQARARERRRLRPVRQPAGGTRARAREGSDEGGGLDQTLEVLLGPQSEGDDGGGAQVLLGAAGGRGAVLGAGGRGQRW